MKLHSMFDAGSVMEFAAQMVDSLSYYRNRLAALDEAARLERLLACVADVAGRRERVRFIWFMSPSPNRTFEKHVEQAESEWHLPTKLVSSPLHPFTPPPLSSPLSKLPHSHILCS